MSDTNVLPYRTTGEDIERFVDELSKGRSLEQIQKMFPRNSFPGSLLTIGELGLFDEESHKLTDFGQQYALANKDLKRELLLKAILDYEPYELLLGANFAHGHENETTIDWIEKWWSTEDFGNSQTNRNEGSTTFAKLIEYVKLGSYYVGRRGHSTRIEWKPNAKDIIEKARVTNFKEGNDEIITPAKQTNFESDEIRNPPTTNQEKQWGGKPISENNRYSLSFKGGRRAELSLPPKLTSTEKQQLISLITLMVLEEDEKFIERANENEDI